jgi:hypothetical protein
MKIKEVRNGLFFYFLVSVIKITKPVKQVPEFARLKYTFVLFKFTMWLLRGQVE